MTLPHRPSRTVRVAAALAALALTAGCINLGSKPPPRLIALTPQAAAPSGALTGGPIAGALLVLDPAADRRLDVTRVAVQVNDAEVAYLKDAAWVERPARQMRRMLAETIRTKGRRLVLEGTDADTGAKAILSGRLIDCGYDAASQSVVVRLDAMLDPGDGAVRIQRFAATVAGVAAEPDLIAAALNQAANQVAGQVADWVAQP